MKRTYNKPTVKSVKLMTAEALLSASGNPEIGVNDDKELGGSGFLSNEEGAHDLWGNEGNGIW